MITVRPQRKVSVALRYFRESLRQDDGYLREDVGRWYGKGAARLGLVPGGAIDAADFEALCRNRHPKTGEQLTVRQRETRRRISFDFVVSAPKSVSIMALVMDDKRLTELHHRAVEVALKRMEEFAAVRVRKEARNEDRTSGEAIIARFFHTSSRAFDPLLHTHLIFFNATYDPVEKCWKALQPGPLVQSLRYFTEVYRAELATGIRSLGYQIHATRHGFEIEGVPLGMIQTFSKRGSQIQKKVAEVAAKLGRELTFLGKAAIAQSTRDPKEPKFTPEELRYYQLTQMPLHVQTQLRTLMANATKTQAPAIENQIADQALAYARDHLFERHSTVEETRLLQEALTFARGSVTDARMREALARAPEYIRVGTKLTTKETLRLEREMIAWVNSQMDLYRPFLKETTAPEALNEGQKQAFTHLVQSRDGISLLEGGAGTGKTFMLKHLVLALHKRGHEVFAFAPTTAAVEVLKKDGFVNATTVQRLLADFDMRVAVNRKVILVDEANLLSTAQMHELLYFAKLARCRVILSGNTGQHSSVEAGDSLRLFTTQSRLRVIPLDQIIRQRNDAYRAAIADLAAHRVVEGFKKLQDMGAIREVGWGRYQEIAKAYVESLKARRSASIISPTWGEIHPLSHIVRQELQETKMLGPYLGSVLAQESLSWTTAQKQDPRNYRPGLVLRFVKETTRFQTGDSVAVKRVTPYGLIVRRGDGKMLRVTRKQAMCFDVCEEHRMVLAQGERLLLQGNQRKDGLLNGQIVHVKALGPEGRIQLTDGRVIPAGFRAFTYGYCTTSHGAEGRTFDDIYLMLSNQSLPAIHREQWYVSASRARHKIQVFTQSSKKLLEALQETGARLAATELIQGLEAPRIQPTQSRKPSL